MRLPEYIEDMRAELRKQPPGAQVYVAFAPKRTQIVGDEYHFLHLVGSNGELWVEVRDGALVSRGDSHMFAVYLTHTLPGRKKTECLRMEVAA